MGNRFELNGATRWVRGENRSDDRPLGQIPPLRGLLGLQYVAERWTAAVGPRWAALRRRVDDNPLTDRGLDFGETPGYGVLDPSGSRQLVAGLAIDAGVDNVLDLIFADHLNRANLSDPDRVPVNEPERSLGVTLSWR